MHKINKKNNSEVMRGRGVWMNSSGGSMKEKMGIRVHVVKNIDRIEKKTEREDCLFNMYCYKYYSV